MASDPPSESAAHTGSSAELAGRVIAPVIEYLRDGALFVAYDLRLVLLNAAARRDMGSRGLDAATLIGLNLWDVLGYAPDMPPRLAVEQAIRERTPTYFTTKGTLGDYWVEVDFVPLEEGCLLYYRDATSRSTAAEERAASRSELQMTSERLRVLIDEAPVAVMVTDNENRVLLWNPAAEAMFQWTAEEVIGQPLPTIPDDERVIFASLQSRVRTGEIIKSHPARRRRKDGVVIDVQLSSAPLHDGEGRIIGGISMASDFTAQRKLESQLRMAQKMEAVGLLAGGVAHDFNNLLTAIKGFTSLLQMMLEDTNDQASEFLDEINKAADRAAALTAQLLAFSRRQLLRPEALHLNGRVRDLERMLRLLLRDAGQLELDLDPSLYQVLADPGQIEQVIMNLVVNARDAIHERDGGRVIIRTRNADLVHEFEQWGVQSAPGDYVKLEVIDNGIGMDRATQLRIFDPFFTTKGPGHGTGLGLATVFGIVKQSGGYVWVESEPNEGASFAVYLPRASTQGRPSGPYVAISRGGEERILIVEDEDAVRRVARRALEMQGYTIIEAADGESALALADLHEIQLLITDVMMPGMLGPSLAAELRKRYPDIPVMFMSGHSEEIVRDGLLDPATPFLAKPFTPAQLALKVRETLDNAKNAEGAP